MSKIIVDEIETSTTNGNLRLIPNGTGQIEIKGAGGDDATLRLNCSAQSHGVKLKSPAHSAGQSYTMILPDNQIAQDKFLKVKSITGSGATAVGQLEYGDVPTPVDPTKMPLTGGTFTGSVTFETGLLQESFHSDGNAITGTHNHDILVNGMTWYGSTNAGGAFTFNIRGNSTTTFESISTVGKVTTITLLSANNNASNYMSAFQIDGVGQTIKWANATAPSAATGSGTDVYTITILKTAASTYATFGNFTNFA
tara:strand:- start:27 stop:788 length:762 start_codon:yes stop_codon:yes gene_type:complete